MLERTLRVLEYNKVKEQLLEHTASSLGRDKVKNLVPSTDFEEIVELQETTDEAAKVIRLKGHVPLGGISDIRSNIKRAKIGSMLSPHELIEIASTMYGSRQMKRFIDDMIDNGVELPILGTHVAQIVSLYDLEKKITNCIGDGGEVVDSASDKLRGIRNQIRTAESRIREKLENMTRSSNAQKMLSDAIVTIRNERYVIPVKQEYRGVYGGIVHDQSASGQTLFIEPQVIVELNNALQEARVKEKQEVERILMMLTEEVAVEADIVLSNVEVVANLDFIFAKALYAKRIKATKPIVNNERYMDLKQARHPLIDPEIIVPNNIMLGKDFTTIVITGPNTGGKTVTLKTVGICVLMAQSGLHIPVMDESEICIFKNIFADIGDEQSIEQSLSTFSSHMVNIVDILEKADFESLVLFDELGAGTDPQEGAALAISILDEVCNRGARVVATTHYPELKAYGYNREQVINASVEFDVNTLSPTYKLLIGVPGRSNAFEISKRLGLSDRVIDQARNHISTDTNKIENMIAKLEESQKNAERDWNEAEALRKQSEKLHRELQRQIIEFNEERDEKLLKAQKEGEEKVEAAKKEAEGIIHELRQLRKAQLVNVKDHELIEAKSRLEGAAPELVKKQKVNVKNTAPKQQLRAGDEVKVLTFGQKGQLLEKVSDTEWSVQIGILKMKVKESNMEYINTPKQTEKKAVASVKGRDYHVSLELDLRGERYEDAMMRVEKYLDDAQLASYPRVSIIHGKGTGALRQGVQDYLKKHRGVKNYRYGDMGEGGLGVTVVELK
ncbi:MULTISPECIES: endonuclease MutS2 [Bacillus]|uniref:Endonuclease MutS2 n=2 Tax=Bacillus cereus group TaxID=86661 RepID=A0A2C1DH24_BACCE|nr:MULTISPECIES: endonuclease MutS2 [Bacillus cereus group]OFD72236.1 endonuclease MutS2 [Bacillus mycoides]OFD72806.1 endonuclease MutS2 [Bacillus mycoides]OFD75704.1 endonuclease MutS2 [Bacillus mycoides]PGS99701.1 endonuclease MutS2 [Bacillus cereus]